MNKIRLFCAIFLALIFAGGTSFAAETAWQIRESHGLVRVQQTAGGVHKASLQEALEPGASLTTGGDGRVVLSNGKQQIVVGPNSRMTVPAEAKSGFTHVLQDLGTLLFKVDKRPTEHFEVDTPMIAAVVKGTTFTVTVGADYAEVHVAEGLVEVKTPDGIGHAMVPSGVTALVSKGNPSKIEIQSPSPATPGSQSAGKTIVPANGAKGQTASIPADLGPGQPDFNSLTKGLLQSGEHSNGNASAGGLARAETALDVASANPQSVPSASIHSQLGPSVNANANANAGGANAGGANANGNANGSGNANAGGANANAGGVNGSTNANANAGGANANSNANAGGVNGSTNANANANAGGANANANANANAGGVNGSTNANANAGGVNANANANAGGANANANANAGSVNGSTNANANAGGANANANANAGGVNANANANANAGGVNASVNAGGAGVSLSSN